MSEEADDLNYDEVNVDIRGVSVGVDLGVIELDVIE